MSNLFDNLTRNVQILSDRFKKNGKKYLNSALSQVEEFGRMGKTQIEIEKLKWELKQKQNELGQYVAEKKISKSATDFSHDQLFLELVNEVARIKLYIEERQNEGNSRESQLEDEDTL